MSDRRLRELEKRWKGTGSVEDEAAYLKERVRAGDLSQERLELAAYCGHEGARLAGAGVVPLLGESDRWPTDLSRFGSVSTALAAVALCEVALAQVIAPLHEAQCFLGDVRATLLNPNGSLAIPASWSEFVMRRREWSSDSRAVESASQEWARAHVTVLYLGLGLFGSPGESFGGLRRDNATATLRRVLKQARFAGVEAKILLTKARAVLVEFALGPRFQSADEMWGP